MEKTRLSSKGQIIIPKAFRDAHGWGPGMDFEIEDTGGTLVLRPVKPFPTTSIDDVVGCLKWHGPPKTLEEMDEGIVREARRSWKTWQS